MINLNSDDVKLIHAELEKKFPMMLKGISKEGLIESAIEKQSGKLYGTERYDSVYKKAAALMEAITRWHIFHDGNKRTGLLCAFLYLYVNQYYLATPIDAVRFTQKIASREDLEQEKIEELIDEIAAWLEKYTAQSSSGFVIKIFRYNLLSEIKLSILYSIGFKKYVKRKIDDLFATDAHPEYMEESAHMLVFLRKLMVEAGWKILEMDKASPKDLELPTLDVMRCAVSEHEVLLEEEDRLFESEPDDRGIRHCDSMCFHCGKKIHLETEQSDEDAYMMTEYDE